MSKTILHRLRYTFADTDEMLESIDTSDYWGAEMYTHLDGMWHTMQDAAARIELLEVALRTIDNAIPKNDPTLPAICLIAGDIAEGALNGTWPAFGVMPRAALMEKKNVD